MAKPTFKRYTPVERLAIAQEAARDGVIDTARKHNMHRASIDAWLKKFKQGKLNGSESKLNGKEHKVKKNKIKKKKYWSRKPKSDNGTIDLKPGHYITKVSKEGSQVVFSFTALPI